eukprot:XP_014626150.1 uncharacterized protein LOC106797005 [Glycine max]
MVYDHRAESGASLGMLSSSSLYGGYGSFSMGDNGYGSMSSYATKLYGGHNLPPPSTLDMFIPANVVGKVLGKGGENIANIRKVLIKVPYIFIQVVLYVLITYPMLGYDWSQSFNVTKNQSEGVISTKGQLGAQLSQEEEKEIGDVGWKAFWDYSSFSRGLVIR